MTTHREYFTDNPNNYMALKGAQVQRYHILTNRMSQGLIEYVLIKKYLNDFKTPKSRHHTNSRIVMQGITGVNEAIRLKAAYLPSNYFCAHSCNYLIPHNDDFQYLSWPLLALLNSNLFNWIFKKTSTNSNVNSYEIENLTIPNKKYGIDKLEILAKYRQVSNEKYCMLFENIINALIYELYFDDEIKAIDAEVIKHLSNLPEIKDNWSNEQKLSVIEKVYKDLSDLKHPVSIAMEKQKTIPEVRIIEGLDA